MYDFPKRKLAEGENTFAGAKRVVEEKIGLKVPYNAVDRDRPITVYPKGTVPHTFYFIRNLPLDQPFFRDNTEAFKLDKINEDNGYYKWTGKRVTMAVYESWEKINKYCNGDDEQKDVADKDGNYWL